MRGRIMVRLATRATCGNVQRAVEAFAAGDANALGRAPACGVMSLPFGLDPPTWLRLQWHLGKREHEVRSAEQQTDFRFAHLACSETMSAATSSPCVLRNAFTASGTFLGPLARWGVPASHGALPCTRLGLSWMNLTQGSHRLVGPFAAASPLEDGRPGDAVGAESLLMPAAF